MQVNNSREFTVECECGNEFEVSEERLEQTEQIMCSSCGKPHDNREIMLDKYEFIAPNEAVEFAQEYESESDEDIDSECKE